MKFICRLFRTEQTQTYGYPIDIEFKIDLQIIVY